MVQQISYINEAGQSVTINLPDYSLESTQQAMLSVLLKSNKIDRITKEEAAATTDLLKNLVKLNKEPDPKDKPFMDLLKETIKNFKSSKQGGGGGASGGSGVGLTKLETKMLKLTGAATAAAIAIGGTLFKGALNLGNTLGRLAESGITDSDSLSQGTINTIAQLNQLGFTASESSDAMLKSSLAISTLGQGAFIELNKELAKTTGYGSSLGMTMSEMSAVLAEDLEIRQTLGIMSQLDAASQAARTADLYKSQLANTQLLGVTLDKIQGASDNTLSSSSQFALRVQMLGKDGEAFVQSTRKMQSALAGMSVPQSVIDQIGLSMVDVSAFLSDGGQELHAALLEVAAAGGEGGTAMAQSLNAINAMVNAGDVKGAEAAMAQLPRLMGEMAESLSPDEMENMIALLSSSGNKMTKELALSFGPMKLAFKNLGNDVNGMPSLAKAAATFDQALAQAQGSLSAGFASVSSIMSAPMSAFADALSKNTYVVDGAIKTQEEYNNMSKEAQKSAKKNASVMDTFGVAVNQIRVAVLSAFGIAGDDVSGLSKQIRDNLVPAIERFGDWMSTDGIEGIKNTFEVVSNIFAGFGSVIEAVSHPIDHFTKILDGGAGEMETKFSLMGKTLGIAIAGWVAFNTFLKAQSAVKAAAGLFGGGASTSAAATSIGKGASGVGKAAGTGMGRAGAGIGALGKGIGKGIGGILTGFAKGLGAFASPGVLMGATNLALSITALSAGLAASAALIGYAMPVISTGMRSFDGIDGDNLVSVAKGMGALGLAMAVLGTGGAVGAVGGVVSGVLDFTSGLFGADDPLDKLKKFAEYDIPIAGVMMNAKAVQAFGDAMQSYGEGTLSASLIDQDIIIADKLFVLFEKFAKLDAVNFDPDNLSKKLSLVHSSGMLDTASKQTAPGTVVDRDTASKQSALGMLDTSLKQPESIFPKQSVARIKSKSMISLPNTKQTPPIIQPPVFKELSPPVAETVSSKISSSDPQEKTNNLLEQLIQLQAGNNRLTKRSADNIGNLEL